MIFAFWSSHAAPRPKATRSTFGTQNEIETKIPINVYENSIWEQHRDTPKNVLFKNSIIVSKTRQPVVICVLSLRTDNFLGSS